jgi:hypothetical protein
MKPKTTLRSFLPLGAAFGLAINPAAHAAGTIIFSDTFNYDGVTVPQTTLNTNESARQAAGLVNSTYVKQGSGTSPIQALNVANSQNTLLLRSSNPNSGTSVAAVDLNTNFATQLAGKSYVISLTDLYFTRGNTDVTDIWFSISLGDGATSINGPNNAEADVASLMRADGSLAAWEDNATRLATGSTLALDYGFATRYAIAELRIDETGPTKTAQAYFKNTAGAEFTSAMWTVDFDNTTNRFIELRAQQSATGTNGTLVDIQMDSLTITVIPEPSAALLGGLGLLMLLRRRRN